MGTWVDFQAVKQAVTLGQVLERYGVKLKRTGKELHGRCPDVHQGKREESFRANTEEERLSVLLLSGAVIKRQCPGLPRGKQWRSA